MRQILFNDKWSFVKTGLDIDVEDIKAGDYSFSPVYIPHDWLIYNGKNLYENSIGWYKREISKDELKNNGLCYMDGEKVFINFDGVYMNSTIYFNGKEIFQWKYGYSAFTVEITDYLSDGDNEIIVKVVHQEPNSRWYSGAGIFRDVKIRVTENSYLPYNSTYFTYSSEDVKNFDVHVETAAVCGNIITGNGLHNSAESIFTGCGLHNLINAAGVNSNACQYKVKYELYRAGSNNVICNDDKSIKIDGTTGAPIDVTVCNTNSKMSEIDETDEAAKANEVFAKIADSSNCSWCDDDRTLFTADFTVNNPDIWDIDSPNLYKLKVSLFDDENVVDEEVITVGFKTVKYTVNDGFFLNGRPLKLQGVCEHHDFGCLGSAFFEDAMRRKFRMLKKMGVNALRTSHNMPASILMDLADEMGILVVSEAFDMWERPKTEYDYARFFNDWVEKDVKSWIERDRNHPSIIMWSIGNEIYDTHAGERGLEITKQLLSLVKKSDPGENGRATLGSNYMPWENTQKCADIYKLAGYNYGAKYYEDHHKKHPDYVMYGSETCSVVMSRGVYHFPFSQQVLADEDEQCSALGNSNTSWGAKSIEHCIAEDRDVKYSLGQFIWTGFDYIGEPTPYHTRNSYFGQIDTAGFPKDSYYVFMAEWSDVKKNPMVHVFPYWDFNEGQIIDLRACSNGASIELFVNKKSLGVKTLNHNGGRDFTATWSVPFEKGEIEAVAYDENGNEIARETRKSFGDAKALVLNADKTVLNADGRSLCFVEISAVDDNGSPVENAMDYVTVDVTGNAILAGLDNGDSTDDDEYKSNVRKLFNGKLLAVILAGQNAGKATVTVSGEGLKSASVEIELTGCIKKAGLPTQEAFDAARDYLLGNTNKTRIPARKIELSLSKADIFAKKESLAKTNNYDENNGINDIYTLTKENRSLIVNAKVLPENTDDKEIIFKVVNDSGIEVSYVNLRVDKDNPYKATVSANGDGEFWIRAMSRDVNGKIRLISQIGVSAEGIGQAYINPYEFVSGGLHTRTFGTGEIGNGNEKGFSTWFEGASAACFDNIDFGEIGSDEMMMPVFCLSNEGFPFKIYEGTPEDGNVILDSVYQQNYIWNVYQEGNFKLNKRLTGITSISIEFYSKVHIKGFKFKKYEKAFEQLSASKCDKVYGDSFNIEETSVTGIGNNVTLEFENMNFGDNGTSGITVFGRSDLDVNTIHIRFFDEEGNEEDRIIEFRKSDEYAEQTFEFEPVYGNKKVNFVFLPGCKFDFGWFKFQ